VVISTDGALHDWKNIAERCRYCSDTVVVLDDSVRTIEMSLPAPCRSVLPVAAVVDPLLASDSGRAGRLYPEHGNGSSAMFRRRREHE